MSTQVRSDVDLGSLTRQRESIRPPRRTLKYVVPLLILAAFVGILATSLKDLFGKTVDVTVIRPKLAGEGSGVASAGSIALQAAGWVEPDPFPIRVPALATGVIQELLVREADTIKAGDPVARLIDADARIGLEKTDSALAEAKAELARAEVEQAAAERSFEEALAVKEAVGTTKALAEGKAAESRSRASAVAGGESDLTIAEEELAIQKHLAEQGAAGHRAVELAEARVRSAKAALAVLKGAASLATSELDEASTRAFKASRDLDLRIEEKLRVETARKNAELARAKIRSAEANRAEAALRLDRMTIRAPVGGVVMERVAVPGMLMHSEDPEHEIVCLLFDPASLRVRVDVSQADIGKVSVGQMAEIQPQAKRQKPYRGEVVRVVQRADNVKVTLQVHVRILDGDALLRPEMLCNVWLMAPQGTASSPSGRDHGPAGFLVPARVLVEDKYVWTLDPESAVARKRAVEVGSRSGEWALIRQGINLTDKIIDLGKEQVEEGAKVRAREGE
jgi:HlyD family secretion protein